MTDGDFDVAMSGVTVRGDRLARFPMTPAVARAAAVLVVKARDPSPAPVGQSPVPESPHALRAATRRPPPLPGRFAPRALRVRSELPVAQRGELPARSAPPRTVAVNRGGHLERVARSALPSDEIRAVDDNASLDDLLARGEVDAVVTDTLELRSFGSGFAVAAVLAHDRKAYWARDDDLARDLGDWLAAREADGTMARLRERSLGPAASPRRPATLGAGAARAADLVARRLALMPFVAETKRARGLPVEVPAREAEVERRLVDGATAAGLAERPYLELVRAQIDAAKAIQRAVLASPAAAAAPPPFDLATELRPAIDRIDLDLQRELARSAPLGASVGDLLAALRTDAALPGLGDAELRRLARALSQQSAAPCEAKAEEGRQARKRSPPRP
jgi:cyclohexadienyl dehydratase